MPELNGKVAIVTGAARGLGMAIASRFVAEGAKVIVTDILEEQGSQLALTLGKNACFISHDVTVEDNWRAVVREAETIFGTIDVLVNNAGILGVPGPLEEADTTVFKQVLDINIVSVFLGMKTVLDSMKKAGGGSIINMSSLAGLIGTPCSAAYTASKFAVRGITKTAAHDYAQYNIRVNSVHPGFIQTDMTKDMMPANEKEAESFKSNATLLGRLGEASDVANMVLFLASKQSAYSTGSEFVVDGGYQG